MTNFKKNALSTLVGLGMVMSAGAYAADSVDATVSWSGPVPGSVAGESLIITGKNGDVNAFTGIINPATDGTFMSESIQLEAHDNDAVDPLVDAPIVGALVTGDVTWTVVSSDVIFDGNPVVGTTTEVYIDDALVAEDAASATVGSVINVQIKQTADLSQEDIAGKTAQAVAVINASIV